jgi:hypothetical protein
LLAIKWISILIYIYLYHYLLHSNMLFDVKLWYVWSVDVNMKIHNILIILYLYLTHSFFNIGKYVLLIITFFVKILLHWCFWLCYFFFYSKHVSTILLCFQQYNFSCFCWFKYFAFYIFCFLLDKCIIFVHLKISAMIYKIKSSYNILDFIFQKFDVYFFSWFQYL